MAQSSPSGDAESTRPRAGERAVVWTLWFTYGVFYFCRNNLSVANPLITKPITDGGLGFSSEQMGWILAAAKISYGLGQLLNGQLSERFSPRIMLAIGLFGSAALNVLFGLETGFYFLLLVWATNGCCQSLGWTPCMRVAANWVPIARRGKAIGIIGTGYQITQGLTYIVASQAAAHWGWRGALYAPAALLALAGLFMLAALKEAPPQAGAESGKVSTSRKAAQLTFAQGLYWTLYNPALWLLGLTLGVLNACRYGYMDWGLKHLMERQPHMRINEAGLKYFVIAIGATAGSYLAGWATDRFFGSRRAPMVCLLMALLGVISLWYDEIVATSPMGTTISLVVIGFCIFGPQVLLVGTAPSDLAHRGASAAAVGFVNFMGYMGAAAGDVITGYLSSNGGWELATRIWAGWAFAGAAIMALLWNATSHRLTILPASIPKYGGVAVMGIASFAITRQGLPIVPQVISYLGACCMIAAFTGRRGALPGLVVAGAGLLYVFVDYARRQQPVNWNQMTAMAAYGSGLLAALMILVEPKEKP